MSVKPLISIITSTFNSAKTLNDTIISILSQTYDNIEYIVIDGNSTDSTVDILKSSAKLFEKQKINYQWISEPDEGIYNAWNKALNIFNGDWVVFIGSDDYFKNNTIIEELIPYLNEALAQNSNYVYGKIEHINSNNQLIEIAGRPWSIQKKRFTYTMNIGHSGCFHHTSLFKKHGNFNESFKIAGDYEFLLREFKDPNNNAFFVDKSFIIMREGGISGSLNNRLIVIKENHKARKLNKINKFSRELFFWEFRVRAVIIIKSIFGEIFAAKMADLYRKIFLGKQKRWSV